jgi:regulator of protease activity HflC (stomatin/prohibitin superfamily)
MPEPAGALLHIPSEPPALNLNSPWIGTVVLVLLLVRWAIRILREYDRGVVCTLGRFSGVRGPALIFLVPWVQ